LVVVGIWGVGVDVWCAPYADGGGFIAQHCTPLCWGDPMEQVKKMQANCRTMNFVDCSALMTSRESMKIDPVF
jgi:hypothetical protein